VPKVRLDSWKSIAEYLKRSPRTVQRWHAAFGLPVHHFGGRKGPVFSYSEELDAWLLGFIEETEEGDGGSGDLMAARKRRSAELRAQADELWELRAEENLGTIANLYRGAIDQNPANALAFIGMANSIILSALTGSMRCSAAYPRAAEAVERAHRLGFEGLEARCAGAWLQLVYERNWKRAREGFDEVLRQQPTSSYALTGRALLYLAEENPGRAVCLLQEAWGLNTFASASNGFLPWAQYLAGDYEQALETVAYAKFSGDAGSMNSIVDMLATIQNGSTTSNFKRLEEIAAAHPGSPVIQGAMGYVYASSDQAGRARETLHNLQRARGGSQYALALVLAGLNERHQAISCMEESYADGSIWSLGFRVDPILQPLRDDPRIEARIRRFGPQSQAATHKAHTASRRH
jgi:tetratricopeptide (TPR) repeat protein